MKRKDNSRIVSVLFQTRLPCQLHNYSSSIVPALRICALTQTEEPKQAAVTLNNRNLVVHTAKAEFGKSACDISGRVDVCAGEKVTQTTHQRLVRAYVILLAKIICKIQVNLPSRVAEGGGTR